MALRRKSTQTIVSSELTLPNYHYKINSFNMTDWDLLFLVDAVVDIYFYIYTYIPIFSGIKFNDCIMLKQQYNHFAETT